MSISITLDQENTAISTPGEADQYQVANEVVQSEGVPLALFVFTVEDDAYSHPATARDLESWPESLLDAQAAGLDYYRRPDATRVFVDIGLAEEFARVVRYRLQILATSFPTVQASFTGLTTYTIVS